MIDLLYGLLLSGLVSLLGQYLFVFPPSRANLRKQVGPPQTWNRYTPRIGAAFAGPGAAWLLPNRFWKRFLGHDRMRSHAAFMRFVLKPLASRSVKAQDAAAPRSDLTAAVKA